jgi:hypothetical protein
MRQLDLKQLAAKVSVEHGIRVDLDDPIMAVVTLNRLVLEQSANEIVQGVRSATREFEQAAENVQLVLRQEIAKDIGNASTRGKTSIGDVGRADERPAVQRWVAIGLLSGAVLFGCGVWLGTMLR